MLEFVTTEKFLAFDIHICSRMQLNWRPLLVDVSLPPFFSFSYLLPPLRLRM